MSSLLGHATAGAAIYFSHKRLDSSRSRWLLPLFILLAILPDFDYLGVWLFKLSPEPRVSHSLAFCLAAAAVVWLLTARVRRGIPDPPKFSAFALASLSHLPLDLLVGAHPLSLFWPFSYGGVASPVGILPGMVHMLSIANGYLWRNLLIEGVILLPLFYVAVALSRGIAFRALLPRALFLAPFWLACLVWSMGLER